MAAPTATDLIRELARRLGELIVVTSTSVGTDTQVIAEGWTPHFPNTIASNLNGWVYCMSGANSAQEARAKSYTPASSTLTLHTPGYTASTETAIVYEYHRRTSRARKLEAINSGIRQLGFIWPRQVIDTSLTSADDTWTYTVPSAANFAEITKVEVHSGADSSLVGYPFIALPSTVWEVRKSQNQTTGVETLVLQFTGGYLPPPDRVIRLTGIAWYTDLSANTDVLPIGGRWQGKITEWLYDWGKYRILDETADFQPGSETERYRARAMDKLQQAKEDILLYMRPVRNGIVRVPNLSAGGDLSNFNIIGLSQDILSP